MALIPKLPHNSADVATETARTADNSLASSRYRLVKATSTGVDVCGAGENPLGILMNAPASGEYAEVAVSGTEMTGIASGAITQGASLKPASGGKLAAGSSGDECCATALSAAAGDGSYVLVHFNRHNIP